MRRVMLRTIRVLLVVLAAPLWGCAGDDQVRSDESRTTSRSLITSDHGLQLQQWRLADQPEVTAEVMRRYGEAVPLDEDTGQMLRRNGLRLRRLPVSQLDEIRQELGGASMSVDSWLGQVCEWKPLVAAPIRPEPTGVAVDGRIRRFQGGRMELMFRGWTVPMEDGPVMLLELLPRYNQTRPSRLEQMLRRRRFEGEHFTSMTVEVLMEPGWAYLLTFELPSVPWGDEETRELPPVAANGPFPPGPDAITALTVGEILLRENTTPPQRRVMLFVPRIPPRAYPPEHPAAAGAAESEAGATF